MSTGETMLWEKTFRKSWDDFSPYHRSVGNECALNEFDLSMLRYFFEEHVADDLDFLHMPMTSCVKEEKKEASVCLGH